MLKIPAANQDWTCPKCGTCGCRNGTHRVKFIGRWQPTYHTPILDFDVVQITCSLCGYTEDRLPRDAEAEDE